MQKIRKLGISWAVAGRNEGRLADVLKTAGEAESADLTKVHLINFFISICLSVAIFRVPQIAFRFIMFLLSSSYYVHKISLICFLYRKTVTRPAYLNE